MVLRGERVSFEVESGEVGEVEELGGEVGELVVLEVERVEVGELVDL